MGIKEYLIIFGLFANPVLVIGQVSGKDTLCLLVRNIHKVDHFDITNRKIYIVEGSGKLMKETIPVHDSIYVLENRNQLAVFVKVYSSRSRLYCSGLWNSEGFIDEITYYNRDGSIDRVVHVLEK